MTDTLTTPIHDPAYQPGLISRITQTVTEMTTLSEALRMLGALIMVASMSLFLLQDWTQGSDVNRYFLLLIQTILMTSGGFAMSFLLKENKGARVFFNLSLISVIANFTILGALVYSTVQWDGALTNYPQYAHWVVQTDQSMLTAMLAAGVVLLPVTLFGFMITARPVALRLSALYLGLNALLLLPVRDSLFTGAIALFGLLVLPWLLKKIAAGYEHFNTPGGHLVKALLFAPLLILLVRSAMWYSLDSFLILSVSLALFLMLRAFSLKQIAQKNAKGILVVTANIVAHISSFGIAAGVAQLAELYLPHMLVLPVFLSILALVNHELSTRIRNGFLQSWVITATAIIFTGGFIWFMATTSGFWPVLLCIATSLLVITYSWIYHNKLVLIPGIVGLGCGLAVGSQWVIDLAMDHGWITLAIIGAVIIVLASVLERHGTALKLKFSQR